jgi:tetratricopeptide (TPR) repeat protein
MRFRLLTLAVLLPLPASCFLFGGGGSGNPTQYTTCSSDAGRVAWREAQEHLANNRDREALPLLLSVLKKCPDLVRAHLAYQGLAERLGGADKQAMVDRYTRAPDSPGPGSQAPGSQAPGSQAPGSQAPGGAVTTGSPVAAYMRARLAETAYAQAVALDEILKAHPKFAWGYLSRGRVNRGQGRLSEALLNFDRAISNDPELLEARLERAQVLAELGRDEEAAVVFKLYCDKEPADFAATHEYIRLLLYRLARVDEALVYITRLEQAGEKSLALRMDRAAALWRADRAQSAVEIYLEILAADPTMTRAALNIGLLYYEIVPKNESDKARYWPLAWIAFEMFLQGPPPSDGHEQFERTWAVPYRMRLIGEFLKTPPRSGSLADLRWPER